MSDETPDERVDRLLRRVFGFQNEEAVSHVIETIGGLDVIDIQSHDDYTYEVWMGQPSAFTGQELDDIEALFEIREIGVYGDPVLAGTDEDDGLEGTFHAILTVRFD